MYTPVANDVLLFKSVFVFMEQTAEVTQHVVVLTVGGGGLTLQELADSVATFWGTTWKPAITNRWFFEGASAQKVWPLPKSLAVYSTVDAGPGGLATIPAPPQLAGLIVFGTNVAVRGGKPRAYIPGLSTDMFGNDGKLIPSVVTALNTLGAFMAAPQNPLVGGRSTNYAPVSFTQRTHTYEPITGYKPVNSSVATQRRRSHYGHANKPPF